LPSSSWAISAEAPKKLNPAPGEWIESVRAMNCLPKSELGSMHPKVKEPAGTRSGVPHRIAQSKRSRDVIQ